MKGMSSRNAFLLNRVSSRERLRSSNGMTISNRAQENQPEHCHTHPHATHIWMQYNFLYSYRLQCTRLLGSTTLFIAGCRPCPLTSNFSRIMCVVHTLSASQVQSSHFRAQHLTKSKTKGQAQNNYIKK